MKTTSKYLNEGDAKSFSAVVAIALGEKAAMILQQIHYWVSQRIEEENQVYFHEGFYWIWNSYKEWHRTFPFMPEPTIKRIILDLEQKRVVVSSEFNKNSGNRTKWYRIDHDVLAETVKDAEVYYNSLNVKPSDQNEPPSDQNDLTIGSKRSTLSIDLPIDQSSDLANDQTTEDEENIYAPPIEILTEPIQPEQKILIDVLAEEKETPIPPPPLASLPLENVGLAIATTEKPQKRKKNVTSEDLILFKEVWNRDAPAACRRVVGDLTIADEKALRRLIKQFGNRSIEVLQEGLAYARTQKWWNDKSKKLSIANYVSKDKPEDYARNYRDMVEEGVSIPLTVSPTDRPMTQSDIKNAETFVRLKERLNKELLTA